MREPTHAGVRRATASSWLTSPLSLLLCACCAPGAAAAERRITFDHLTVEDGLSSNWVRSIYKDSQGLVWLGTDAGLNRYDGGSFSTLSGSIDDPSSLAGERITTIVEDARKRLWVACAADGGIALFDRGTHRFRRFRAGPTPGGLSGNDVPAMVADRQGRLWVGTNRGLDRLDPDTFAVEHFPVETTVASGPVTNHVAALAEDREGRLWVGTYAGLLRLDRASGRYTRLPVGTDESPGPGRVTVFALHQDAGGALWVGSQGAGLYRIDPSSDRYTRYLPNPRSNDSLSSATVSAITSDAHGRILLGTENGGLSVLDPRTGGFTRYLPDIDDETSIGSKSIYSLLLDDQGILWIGTFDGGVNLVSPVGQRFRTIRAHRGGLNYRHVGALAEDPTGDLWIGTDGGGLNRMDRRTGRFTYYRHDPLDQGSVGSDAIIELYLDPRGTLWVGTWDGGLNRLDPGAARFVRYRNDPRDPRSLRDNRVWTLLEPAGGGELLVGTHVGVDVLDRATGRFSRLATRHPKLAEGQPVYALETDGAGRLWIGSLEPAALQVVDRRNGSVIQHRHDPRDPKTPCAGTVQALCRDSRDNMWVGSEHGLSVLRAGTSEFRRFTTDDGLPHDSVTGILEDGDGHLWLEHEARPVEAGGRREPAREAALPQLRRRRRPPGARVPTGRRAPHARGRDLLRRPARRQLLLPAGGRQEPRQTTRGADRPEDLQSVGGHRGQGLPARALDHRDDGPDVVLRGRGGDLRARRAELRPAPEEPLQPTGSRASTGAGAHRAPSAR